jgi:maltose/maltodextrin transport system substrate-binding protein/arabinogalactan oligomer/maltooligosaccharide transport system substrate-binding protein
MKRIVIAVLLFSIAVFPAIAAGEPEPAFEIQEGAELVIWADETRSPILEGLGAQFTEQYGVPVVVQQLGFGDIRDNMKVAAPAGEGPDIIIGAHDWLGELVASGLVAPIDLGSKKDDFTEASIAGFTYDGQLYGMPYAVENLALVYNTDIVDAPPADWAALRELSIELQRAGTVQYGFARQEGDPYHFFPIQTAFGGYVFGVNPDGTYKPDDVGIDNEGSIEALQWLEDMIKDGHTPAGLDWGGYHAMFYQAETAMIITGPWALPDIRNSGIPFAIAPIPGGGKPFLGVQGFMVSAFSENVPMATAFLTEFVAQTEPMFTLYEEGGRPPALIDALEMVEDDALAGFGEAGREGLPMPAIPEMSAVWSSWGDAVTLVMQGQSSAEEAFMNAAEQIRNTIAGN